MCIILATIAIACGGCITYPADSRFFESGQVRNLDDELKDLKVALDRRAITLDEYERQKAALVSSFDGGGSRIVWPLTDEGAREFMKNAGEPEIVDHL